MFYKIAKTLSKVTIIFGFVLMVGGGSEKSQELFYLYEALGIVTFAAGAFALEYFRMLEYRHRKRKIREAREHARREAA
jgi:hypothetical protein